MIGKLTGKIDAINDDSLIIDVGGVGYIVYCSNKTLCSSIVNDPIIMLIETITREDGIFLFGFKNTQELYWFKQLTTVKGVGAKLALSILSHLSPEQIQASINAQDKNSFKNVSGVGGKIAERILIELKGKNNPNSNLNTPIISNNNIDDAISALINLGYNRIDAHNATQKIATTNNNHNVSELIRLSLKELAK
jgi:holliday junction DNA helicase RuvA